MIMFGREYKEQLSKLKDRISGQGDEINSLRLELEAYRDHGIIFSKTYKHRDREYYFEMNADTYLNIKRSDVLFDDYVQVAYQPVDNDVDASVDIDITDAEEEITRLNRELVQARLDLALEQSKSISESALKQLHETLDEMSGGHTM